MSARSVLAAAEHLEKFIQVIVCALKELAMQKFLRTKQGSSIVKSKLTQCVSNHFLPFKVSITITVVIPN